MIGTFLLSKYFDIQYIVIDYIYYLLILSSLYLLSGFFITYSVCSMIYIEFYNEFLNTIIGQQKYHIILLIGLLLISTIFKWRFQIKVYNDYFLSLTIFFTDQHTFLNTIALTFIHLCILDQCLQSSKIPDWEISVTK